MRPSSPRTLDRSGPRTGIRQKETRRIRFRGYSGRSGSGHQSRCGGPPSRARRRVLLPHPPQHPPTPAPAAPRALLSASPAQRRQPQGSRLELQRLSPGPAGSGSSLGAAPSAPPAPAGGKGRPRPGPKALLVLGPGLRRQAALPEAQSERGRPPRPSGAVRRADAAAGRPSSSSTPSRGSPVRLPRRRPPPPSCARPLRHTQEGCPDRRGEARAPALRGSCLPPPRSPQGSSPTYAYPTNSRIPLAPRTPQPAAASSLDAEGAPAPGALRACAPPGLPRLRSARAEAGAGAGAAGPGGGGVPCDSSGTTATGAPLSRSSAGPGMRFTWCLASSTKPSLITLHSVIH